MDFISNFALRLFITWWNDRFSLEFGFLLTENGLILFCRTLRLCIQHTNCCFCSLLLLFYYTNSETFYVNTCLLVANTFLKIKCISNLKWKPKWILQFYWKDFFIQCLSNVNWVTLNIPIPNKKNVAIALQFFAIFFVCVINHQYQMIRFSFSMEILFLKQIRSKHLNIYKNLQHWQRVLNV